MSYSFKFYGHVWSLLLVYDPLETYCYWQNENIYERLLVQITRWNIPMPKYLANWNKHVTGSPIVDELPRTS